MIQSEEREIRHRAKKDTKRWCKGRVGELHDYQIHIEVNTVNSELTELKKWYLLWTRCIHCGRKKDYLGIFYKGERWVIRKSRWITERDRLRMQEMLDVAQRDQGDEIASGFYTNAISRKDRHFAVGHSPSRKQIK